MSRVELIYDADCPNVPAARKQLLHAFAAIGAVPKWQEWDRGATSSPVHVRDYASPTVLVDGRDVALSTPIAGDCACRIYTDETGRLSGVPRLEDVTIALSTIDTVTSAVRVPARTFQESLPALPAIGLALLPKLTCAACWPAYAGLASNRRGFTPLVLGSLGASVVLVGKFFFDSDTAPSGVRPDRLLRHEGDSPGIAS